MRQEDVNKVLMELAKHPDVDNISEADVVKAFESVGLALAPQAISLIYDVVRPDFYENVGDEK